MFIFTLICKNNKINIETTKLGHKVRKMLRVLCPKKKKMNRKQIHSCPRQGSISSRSAPKLIFFSFFFACSGRWEIPQQITQVSWSNQRMYDGLVQPLAKRCFDCCSRSLFVQFRDRLCAWSQATSGTCYGCVSWRCGHKLHWLFSKVRDVQLYSFQLSYRVMLCNITDFLRIDV